MSTKYYADCIYEPRILYKRVTLAEHNYEENSVYCASKFRKAVLSVSLFLSLSFQTTIIRFSTPPDCCVYNFSDQFNILQQCVFAWTWTTHTKRCTTTQCYINSPEFLRIYCIAYKYMQTQVIFYRKTKWLAVPFMECEKQPSADQFWAIKISI